MRVLVCGGRNYGGTDDEIYELGDALDELHAKTPITAVIQGGATGADEWARSWGDEHGVKVVTVPALWTLHGKAAGPIRNQRMVDDFKPDVVLAFKGGRGTADMVWRATQAGIRVENYALPQGVKHE